MTNTQKLEEIKTAKMQKLKDLEEDNTLSFISNKSQHFLFQLLQSASTIFYYRSIFKRFPVTLQQASFFSEEYSQILPQVKIKTPFQ